ncbi:ATP-binding cassette domain-containing protein [Candidatus Thiosymbion oneisti]|uniref:ATP-binding cassette domain-containing protein n=1 Tax=Candidatus Thiosymbion oneisti TaxID=589554 RepID=UPI000AE1C177|nr:ATP-binding cassette domain-containing protein [Candidatus Thiosymbion oneisti]
MDQPIISLRGISRAFRSGLGERVEILTDLDLDIAAGSFNVIRGESGSGKTTLLRILGMLDTGFSGDYSFAGHAVRGKPDWFLDELRAENIGFIFQEGRLFNHLTLRKNIETPLLLQGDRERRQAAPQIVEDLAPRFFDDGRRDEILALRPGPASGGQKQRASIMRAIVNRPSIILADEPTASLHGDLKNYVVEHLKTLCADGHTVIVVSHDSVFYDTGRQLELDKGKLRELTPPPETPNNPGLPVQGPATGLAGGWKPRAPVGILLKQAIRETLSRPIFLGLILISLIVGVCQVSVFASVIIGAQEFVDDAMTKGSRLNRVEIKPRRADRGQDDRFPGRGEIAAWEAVDKVVPRRVTLASLVNRDGSTTTYSAMGLHAGDPEYGLLDFVAGGPFSGGHDQLQVIVTASLLGELFDITGLEVGTEDYDDFIGRQVTIRLGQYTPSGNLRGETSIKLRVQGIILYAEGGRQLYLPNTTHLAFDRFKRDRRDEFPLPLNEAADAWTDTGAVAHMADFPWEDSLQIYARGMRDVIPVIKQVAKQGYKPRSDIWRFKWALDVQDTAWTIFIPLLALIVLAVAITVAANIFTSAKLRETELALWRVLGMRRGDLVLTQVLATAFSVTVGTVLGLTLGAVLVDQSKALLAQRGADAAVQDGDPQTFDAIFAPVSEFYVPILLFALVLGIVAALYPAFRTANTDPAKVLQS